MAETAYMDYALSKRPGRYGGAGDRGFGCANGRQAGTKVFGGYKLDGPWGVRVGDTQTLVDERAWWLTPDDAEELAEHLRRCAAWARAQETLEPTVLEAEAPR